MRAEETSTLSSNIGIARRLISAIVRVDGGFGRPCDSEEGAMHKGKSCGAHPCVSTHTQVIADPSGVRKSEARWGMIGDGNHTWGNVAGGERSTAHCKTRRAFFMRVGLAVRITQ